MLKLRSVWEWVGEAVCVCLWRGEIFHFVPHTVADYVNENFHHWMFFFFFFFVFLSLSSWHILHSIKLLCWWHKHALILAHTYGTQSNEPTHKSARRMKLNSLKWLHKNFFSSAIRCDIGEEKFFMHFLCCLFNFPSSTSAKSFRFSPRRRRLEKVEQQYRHHSPASNRFLNY